jgi:hypothetical protein
VPCDLYRKCQSHLMCCVPHAYFLVRVMHVKLLCHASSVPLRFGLCPCKKRSCLRLVFPFLHPWKCVRPPAILSANGCRRRRAAVRCYRTPPTTPMQHTPPHRP